jgi:hypothetical protein
MERQMKLHVSVESNGAETLNCHYKFCHLYLIGLNPYSNEEVKVIPFNPGEAGFTAFTT